ncbi:hypothetical protein TNCV_1841821 [Trichonephila clavipes]|nr:hypothetical protein TNCV_1841821 [Trichonephila clavipes]
MLPDSTDKFRGVIVVCIGMTNQHRTWGQEPCLSEVISKNSYGGCDFDWNEKGQEEARNTFIRRKACLQYEQRIPAPHQKCNDN